MPPVGYPDPPLQSARIRLRPLAEADIPAIVAACRDPDSQRFMVGLPSPYGEAEARSWLAHIAAEREAGVSLDLAIVDRRDGRLLGCIGPTGLESRQRVANVGYWTAPEARGQGYQSEALGLLTRWLFSEMGIERIELSTAPDNVASQRVARAAGFRLEGYGRAHLALGDGRRRDSLLYALTAADLQARPSERPRVVWLNGTFGAGKSSTAAELKRRRPELTVYDPEAVGVILREFVAVPTGDFQDLPEWREGVAALGASLARHRGGSGVLAPMTLWRREYLVEIFTALRAAGVEVAHVLIDARDEVLATRIDADSAASDARGFRRARLADYSAARDVLRASADLVIDSGGMSVSEVADRVEPLLG